MTVHERSGTLHAGTHVQGCRTIETQKAGHVAAGARTGGGLAWTITGTRMAWLTAARVYSEVETRRRALPTYLRRPVLEEVSEQLHRSRSDVVRLLRRAREAGLRR